MRGMDDQKEKFSIWLKQIYRELYYDKTAIIIMGIVSYAKEFQIVYMPLHDHSDIENKEQTIKNGCVKKTFIAAKNYEDEENRNILEGLIIQKFCRFALYKTFGNRYLNDERMNLLGCSDWDAVTQECMERRSYSNLIGAAFDDYTKDEWKQELVVRYFQYLIEHRSDGIRIKLFGELFPRLRHMCEAHLFPKFYREYHKIRDGE